MPRASRAPCSRFAWVTGLAWSSEAPASAAASVTFWMVRLLWVLMLRSTASAANPNSGTAMTAIIGSAWPRSPRRRQSHGLAVTDRW